MLAAVLCRGRLGVRYRCQLRAFHDGDHVGGGRTWPRTTRELAALARHEGELRRLREQVVGWASEPSHDDPVGG